MTKPSHKYMFLMRSEPGQGTGQPSAEQMQVMFTSICAHGMGGARSAARSGRVAVSRGL